MSGYFRFDPKKSCLGNFYDFICHLEISSLQSLTSDRKLTGFLYFIRNSCIVSNQICILAALHWNQHRHWWVMKPWLRFQTKYFSLNRLHIWQCKISFLKFKFGFLTNLWFVYIFHIKNHSILRRPNVIICGNDTM